MVILSPYEHKRFKELWCAGTSLQDIAATMGWSLDTINEICRGRYRVALPDERKDG